MSGAAPIVRASPSTSKDPSVAVVPLLIVGELAAWCRSSSAKTGGIIWLLLVAGSVTVPPVCERVA